MIFMKNYALIAMASACFLFTACTNDELDSQNLNTSTSLNQNDFNFRAADSTALQTDPVKTNGRED
jgi:hypothetical protein